MSDALKEKRAEGPRGVAIGTSRDNVPARTQPRASEVARAALPKPGAPGALPDTREGFGLRTALPSATKPPRSSGDALLLGSWATRLALRFCASHWAAHRTNPLFLHPDHFLKSSAPKEQSSCMAVVQPNGTTSVRWRLQQL